MGAFPRWLTLSWNILDPKTLHESIQVIERALDTLEFHKLSQRIAFLEQRFFKLYHINTLNQICAPLFLLQVESMATLLDHMLRHRRIRKLSYLFVSLNLPVFTNQVIKCPLLFFHNNPPFWPNSRPIFLRL